MINALIKIALYFVIIFVIAVFAGTLVWLIWPYVVPFVFPAMVAEGFIVEQITWLDAVLLSWLFGLLFKNNSTSS